MVSRQAMLGGLQKIADGRGMLKRYLAVRQFTEALVEPLSPEDCVIQSMPDVSPTRWHIAHSTWFFETFVLSEGLEDYQPFHPDFCYLFNSYYNAVGVQFPRPNRGLLSRPSVAEIFKYRKYVDARMRELLETLDPKRLEELSALIEIGLQHEQQHQELMLTDIKHVLSCNPLYPVYRKGEPARSPKHPPLGWLQCDEGVCWIGHEGEGFAYDNESPRHREFVESFELAARLTTNGEYLEFIGEGGYQRPDHWLSAGWNQVREEEWKAPLYWERREDGWWHFTLSGLRPVDPAEPVCHLSYFEADAFARWSGARLPTEVEWELASEGVPMKGNFAGGFSLHPLPATDESTRETPAQMFGDVWEWTASPYTAYPGYEPPAGALGEYNGKFMCNQYVLRGGSCATSHSHIRRTYRNFFPPEARWQFTGLRLAR